MTDELEKLRVLTSYAGVFSIQAILPFYLSDMTENNVVLYTLITAYVFITELMWICVVAKMFIEMNESELKLVQRFFFHETFNLSAAATYLFFFAMILALVKGNEEIVSCLVLWQISHATADVELSAEKTYRKRHTTFILFCTSVVVSPILGRREINSRLADVEYGETLVQLVDFHKFGCLSGTLSVMALALAKKEVAYDILFPTVLPLTNVRFLVDFLVGFPIVPFWMVIIVSTACDVNLWFPMLMHQLMFDTVALLMDEIYWWYAEMYGAAEDQEGAVVEM